MVKLCFAGNGGTGTVREYLEIVDQNTWVAVAAGAVVCGHTRCLMELLHDHGDRMPVTKMQKLMRQLDDEINAAMGAARVTGIEMQQVGAEMATVGSVAGRAPLSRRGLRALLKRMIFRQGSRGSKNIGFEYDWRR